MGSEDDWVKYPGMVKYGQHIGWPLNENGNAYNPHLAGPNPFGVKPTSPSWDRSSSSEGGLGGAAFGLGFFASLLITFMSVPTRWTNMADLVFTWPVWEIVGFFILVWIGISFAIWILLEITT
jgi:hypothetical protein